MPEPDNERGRLQKETGPRKLAAKLAPSSQSTSPDMVDGVTNVGTIPAERRGRTYSPLALQLLDTERAADRLLEELGAAHCRRLAVALLELVQGAVR